MTIRERIASALIDAGEGGVSGEMLARELGVSRVAVAKHVAALRAQGYSIDARAGCGYRMSAVPDLALPFEVRRLVRDPFWVCFEGGPSTGSTNDDARRLAGAGAAEGTVVVAAEQVAGRGRLGRAWESPGGGAYVSVLLRPGVAPAELGPLALVTGLGIARGLDSLGVRVKLKWPNDLLVDEGKLGGILLEMAAEGDRVEWVVAGFGLNVRRGPSPAQGAAYLEDLAPGAGPARAAAAALDGIAETYRQWKRSGFGPLLPGYRERFSLAGCHVVVRDAAGGVRAQGVARGVDEEGRLVVAGEDGDVAVSSGEVTLRSPV